MYKEYMVLHLSNDDLMAEESLNKLSYDGWVVVCYAGDNRVILFRERADTHER